MTKVERLVVPIYRPDSRRNHENTLAASGSNTYMTMDHILNVSAEYAGMTSCKESAARVTKATLKKYQFHSLVLPGQYANLTAKSSRQNKIVVKAIDLEPNALRPISAYDLRRGSSKII